MKLAILFLAAILWCVSADQAGVHLVVAQSGLDQVTNIIMPFITREVDALVISDISGVSDTSIGDVEYTLTNIKVSNFDADIALATIAGTGLQLRASELQLNIDMNWSYREKAWPHVKDSGTADFDVKSAFVSVDIDVQLDGSKPKISFQNPQVLLEKYNLKVHGGASWLYNFFIGLFKSKIRKEVEQQVVRTILSTLTRQTDYFISNFPFEEPIDKVILRYPLVQNPTFTNAFVDAGFKGDAISKKYPDRHYEGPVPPVNLPAQMSRMLSIIVTDYTINSIGFAYFQSNSFNWYFIASDLPGDFPIAMNTSAWAFLFPTLSKLYPNSEMGIEYEASAPLTSKITENGIGVGIDTVLRLYVVAYENETRIDVLIADIHVDVNVKVASVGDTIIPTIEFVDNKLTFTNSSIPEVKSELPFLTQLIAFIVRKIIIPYANQQLSSGFSLPVLPGTNIKDPLITLHPGFFAVNVNFSGRPSQSVQALNRKAAGNVIHVN